MEYSVSTLKTNTIQAATGTTLNITSGHKLTGAAGSIVAPGQVVQVVQTVYNGQATYSNSGSTSDITGMTVTITPKSASNKVMITCQLSYSTNTDGCGNLIILLRGSTVLGGQTNGTSVNGWFGLINNNGQANGAGQLYMAGGEFLDSPNTTSATTYKLQHHGVGGTTPFIHNKQSGTTALAGISTLTAMEIAG
tara:strand:+ start:494 stop:1075 length:582 start_codon:yes stop_codon:yes gene_type:complete